MAERAYEVCLKAVEDCRALIENLRRSKEDVHKRGRSGVRPSIGYPICGGVHDPSLVSSSVRGFQPRVEPNYMNVGTQDLDEWADWLYEDPEDFSKAIFGSDFDDIFEPRPPQIQDSSQEEILTPTIDDELEESTRRGADSVANWGLQLKPAHYQDEEKKKTATAFSGHFADERPEDLPFKQKKEKIFEMLEIKKKS